MNVVWGENTFSEEEKPSCLKVLRDEDDIILYLKELNYALLKENELIRLKLDILQTYVNMHGGMSAK